MPAPAPARAAYEWVQLILDGHVREAWPRTDPNLRRCLVQWWMCDQFGLMQKPEKSREQIVERLAKPNPRHDSWDDFAAALTEQYRKNWTGDEFDDLESQARSAEIRPGLVRVGLAKRPDQPKVWDGIMLMRNLAGRWVVVGVHDGEKLPTLGWPPS